MRRHAAIRMVIAVVSVGVAATACTSTQHAEIEVAGTLLRDGEWTFQLDEDSTARLDSGQARVDIGWRTSVRCTDGSRLRQRNVQEGWRLEVRASGFRGEHIPTLLADRVRVHCHNEFNAAAKARSEPDPG